MTHALQHFAITRKWPARHPDRLPAEQMALARNLGWGNAALRVLPQGLRIDMGPAGLR